MFALLRSFFMIDEQMIENWKEPTPTIQDLIDASRMPVENEAELEVEAMPPPPVKIFFKEGEPTTFEEYNGQHHIIGQLHNAVFGMDPKLLNIDPTCFIGMAGSGKTLLAKVTANEIKKYNNRKTAFFEVFPADVPDTEALDIIMRKVVNNPGCVVFIDEVHDLNGSHALKLYEVLENNRYKFGDSDIPVELPSFTLLSATTDFGLLHPAMRRRWIRHTMEPASEVQLLHYIKNRGYPITKGAANLIVSRTKFGGAPWEAIEMFRLCVPAARARGSTIIQVEDVEQVLNYQRIDELGLRWMDRQVIRSLFKNPKYRASGDFVCYAASETNTVTLSQIDSEEYRQTIRPKLMSRGLLEIRAYYGQALTARAVKLYNYLKPEEN